ncbi:Rnf-Nqr domain containing protein [Pseudomonas sp. 10B1]|uniref:Rnf-Nqr domain containing protein n=1 Tax=unclassified Pseudomonas TaxID=196821 RepID=UPI002AB48418|nr:MULTISPECIES: Rnf-Nqr domain containing protein [unclassified Pseudomonas]MDY7561611.1 Rnf-Nqr domain containing protein [Pseudomonas sp. AB6]MEA9978374.1 Rnf-Nqr domain containing protein [Pseudomonas sp. RTS4]MEA9994503.1 Rnf-Nqr domain containing protein [Pseudomonas sp. AA4]MEB0085647.1 Rnf-Nqr domain containing protein [Pseudomonas sp. RTI1]MEB0126027.1 Rnf-Nqr domain containing protein [Pseudomonas sp. CCC1.2]
MNNPTQHFDRPRCNALLGPLSLTPILGVTDSLTRAVGLLTVLWVVAGAHAVLMQPIRRLLTPAAELLASALLAALLVSCIELAIQARALALYQGLGIYLPLVSIYCVLSNHSHKAMDLRRSCTLVARFCALMLTLALLRELLGNGTLFSQAQWLFGNRAAHWEIRVAPGGAHLALLTPGGFILLGLLLAANNYRTDRRAGRRPTHNENTHQHSTVKEMLHP